MIEKLQAIVDRRNHISDRIDRRFGAFTQKSVLLHEENLRRLHGELREAGKKEK